MVTVRSGCLDTRRVKRRDKTAAPQRGLESAARRAWILPCWLPRCEFMTDNSAHRLSPRTWALAVLEIGAAILIARLMLDRLKHAGPEHAHHHGMAEPSAQWGWWECGALGAATIGLGVFVLRRSVIAALAAAAGLVSLAASPAVRLTAASSHLVAMGALEVLLVAAPLLVVSALPHPERRGCTRIGYSVLAVTSATAYAGLLIVFHLPAVHDHSGMATAVKGWVPLLVVAVGVLYWFSILRTGFQVSLRLRRAVLFGGQEVAAFIGLLSLLGAFSTTTPYGGAGLSGAWDQRLGGLVMILACALVAVPILRRLKRLQEPVPSRDVTPGSPAP